jgi:hypothetical protein
MPGHRINGEKTMISLSVIVILLCLGWIVRAAWRAIARLVTRVVTPSPVENMAR